MTVWNTCLIEGCTNQTVYRICVDHWKKLNIELRRRWWQETQFGRELPGEELLKEINNYLTDGGKPMDRMLQFFEYKHLKPELQEISKPFGQLAELIVYILPQNPERTVALRKLLEAKDCAVRAKLEKAP